MAACGFPAQQLAEFGDHQGGAGVQVWAGVEHHIGALRIAGEQQQLGQQDACADIGRGFAHGGIRGTQRIGQIAVTKQATSFTGVRGIGGGV